MSKILVVEDDKYIALSMVIRLEASGFEVETAEDAAVALERALANPPDLMLVDIAIPAGGGFGFVEAARSTPRLSSIPFIFVTASQESGVRQKGLDLGASGVFLKPYDFEDLSGAIDAALRAGAARTPEAPA